MRVLRGGTGDGRRFFGGNSGMTRKKSINRLLCVPKRLPWFYELYAVQKQPPFRRRVAFFVFGESFWIILTVFEGGEEKTRPIFVSSWGAIYEDKQNVYFG